MELLNELADLDIAPAAMAKVQALFEQQQAKLVQRDAVLAEKDFKITALTHELAVSVAPPPSFIASRPKY